MLRAQFKKYTLNFKHPGGTSRGVLASKNSWFIFVYDEDNPLIRGIGECGILPKLSIDDRPDFEEKIMQVCNEINKWQYWLEEGLFKFPAIRFGLETAICDLSVSGTKILFPSLFTQGKDAISINGLIWMGDYNTMRKQIVDKIELGYTCVKVKIGAINFDDELNLLRLIRTEFSEKEIELRLDANGAFSVRNALEKLKRLSEYSIHSIEQPIKQHQWEAMAEICSTSPIPIALDEELIGIYSRHDIIKMLQTIKPQYIILKPGLLGGWKQSNMFIEEAENHNVSWWITSALESNIGLNAIAQWAYTLNSNMHQGLGTGQLFRNNILSPLSIKQDKLYYNIMTNWDLTGIENV